MILIKRFNLKNSKSLNFSTIFMNDPLKDEILKMWLIHTRNNRSPTLVAPVDWFKSNAINLYISRVSVATCTIEAHVENLPQLLHCVSMDRVTLIDHRAVGCQSKCYESEWFSGFMQWDPYEIFLSVFIFIEISDIWLNLWQKVLIPFPFLHISDWPPTKPNTLDHKPSNEAQPAALTLAALGIPKM